MMNEDAVILIKVTPNAPISKIVGWKEGELCIKLAAVPEKGQANKALVQFLAKTMGLRQNQIVILSGETNRRKKIKISGMSLEEIRRSIS